jgi:DtxR family Mn-dependent transcriptional regulator
MDDYLETLYFLASPMSEYQPSADPSPTLAVRVAELLGVSRVSVGEMLRRMESRGLIERDSDKAVVLTARGRARAEGLARRHRILERFLTDLLGLTPAEAHERADQIGDPFSDREVDQLAERLGQPERCPHGWPIDPAAERAEDRQLRSLSAVGPGATVVIVRLIEFDAALLRWYFEQGLVPGTRLDVVEAHLSAEELVVSRDGSRRPLSVKAAQGILVRAS